MIAYTYPCSMKLPHKKYKRSVDLMKAMVITGRGSVDVFREMELPTPEPMELD